MSTVKLDADPATAEDRTPLLDGHGNNGGPAVGGDPEHIKEPETREHAVAIPAANEADVQDPAHMWQKARKLMRGWLALSLGYAVALVCFVVAAQLGPDDAAITTITAIPNLLACMLPLVPACMYLCSCCGDTDMATQVRATIRWGLAAIRVDAFAGVMALAIACCAGMCHWIEKKDCVRVNVLQLLNIACMSSTRAWYAYAVVRTARGVADAMAVVSPGLVQKHVA